MKWPNISEETMLMAMFFGFFLAVIMSLCATEIGKERARVEAIIRAYEIEAENSRDDGERIVEAINDEDAQR